MSESCGAIKVCQSPPKMSSRGVAWPPVLYCSWCKILYEAINNFTISFGSSNPGFPLEILGFLIIISSKNPAVRERPHIYLFPQWAIILLHSKRLRCSATPPLPVLPPTRLFTASRPAPLLPTQSRGLTAPCLLNPP